MLTTRNGWWYLRRAVPESIRPIVGKREWVLALRTKSADEAKRLGLKAALDVVACMRSGSFTDTALRGGSARPKAFRKPTLVVHAKVVRPRDKEPIRRVGC
ncbi:MAG: DUF6538 domain-containing protein [Candidatus Rokuibacteriota bacterium]